MVTIRVSNVVFLGIFVFLYDRESEIGDSSHDLALLANLLGGSRLHERLGRVAGHVGGLLRLVTHEGLLLLHGAHRCQRGQ